MRIVIVTAGLESRHLRIQPFRTLAEVGRQLDDRGNDVVFISNGAPDKAASEEVAGVPVRRVPSVSTHHARGNTALMDVIDRQAPDLVFWHLGLTSFLHQDLQFSRRYSVVGIVTSPIHRPQAILRLGPRKIASNIDLIATQLAGSLAPGRVIRRVFQPGRGLCGLVTLSETTRQYLIRKGVPAARVWVAPPGVDDGWLCGRATDDERRRTRLELGFAAGDVIVTYFGSPAPVRGVATLWQAIETVARDHPEIKLLILSRRWPNEWRSQTEYLRARGAGSNGHSGRVCLMDGYLDQRDLVRIIDASHAVCLPFELLPSDVPLSVLEAMALGQGVITTTVACIPELIGTDRGFLVPPASVDALAERLRLVVEQPELVAESGQRARAFVAAQRTWQTMGAALQHVVETVPIVR
jgi:glycosyltransferase involved in cell wall biosynthesis